ncbi:MAG: sigma-70 family RNA polymerase sigma factor, partial [Planctomycetes bacterium]|nr:sigma-70 family RNA polymerase sigma factor [Planctomycetota bacterium]
MASTAPDPLALERAARELRALARALLRDEHGADELVQDAWVRALEQPPRKGLLARGWWRAVLRRAAHRRGVRERARRAREIAVARAEALPPADRARERAEIAQRVTAAVAALEEPFRTAIALRYLEELPPRVIARQLGVPLATVKSRLARGLRSLREQLANSGEPPAAGWLAALALTALPAPSAAASAAALAFPCGVLAMKTKLALAVLLVLAVGGFGWYAAKPPGTPRSVQLAPREHERGDARANIEARTQIARAQTEAPAEGTAHDEPSRSNAPELAHSRTLRLQILDFEGRALDSEAVELAEGTSRLHDWAHETAEASATARLLAAPGGVVEIAAVAQLLRPALRERVALEFLEIRGAIEEELPPQTLRVDRARSLALRVVDAERRALPACEIRCGPDGRMRRERSGEHRLVAVRALQERVRSTDANGRVELAIGASEMWHLEVSSSARPDLQPAYRALPPGDGPLELEIALELRSTPKFRGRLVDESEHPIAEARVFFPSSPEHTTRSDAAGRFAFGEAPLLDALRVEAAGFVPRELHALESPLGEERTIVLTRGGALAGRLLAEAPELLAVARLEAQPMANEHARERHETQSDATGRFAFPSLRAGPHLLRAITADERTLAVARVEVPDDDAALVLGAGLELARALRGRVVDRRSGEALANVELSALVARAGGLQWVSTSLWRTTSDRAGNFELRDLPWQATLLSLEFPGYVPHTIQPRLYPAGTTELAIELDRERTLRARVLDLEGRPVPEAEVRALDRDGNSLSLRTRPESFATFVHTDPEGRVNLAGLPARELTLLARQGSWCTALPVEVAADSADAEIELRLAVIAPRLR